MLAEKKAKFQWRAQRTSAHFCFELIIEVLLRHNELHDVANKLLFDLHWHEIEFVFLFVDYYFENLIARIHTPIEYYCRHCFQKERRCKQKYNSSSQLSLASRGASAQM